jgi:hypothetical protein
VEISAVADEIRAHGDEHAHVFDSSAIGVEQDLHELGGFIARASFFDACVTLAEAGEAKAEQFLELVDDQTALPAG